MRNFDRLLDDGALPARIDFRRLYATLLASCAGSEPLARLGKPLLIICS